MGSGASKNCRKNREHSSDINNDLDQADINFNNVDPVQRESEHPRDILANPGPHPRTGSKGIQPGSTQDAQVVVFEVQSHDSDCKSIIEKELQEALEKECQPKSVESDTESNSTSDLRQTEKTPSIFNENFNKLLAEHTDQEKMSLEKSMSKQCSLRTDSTQPKDIMISYSHKDDEMMRKCRDALESAGISVWVDVEGLNTGSEFLNKIGQAIVEAKLFMQLLSIPAAQSKYCRDELALAYVSSKPIFPVAIEERDDILPHLDFGQKLQLAPVQWTMITKENDFDSVFGAIIESMKSTLRKLDDIEVEDNKSLEESSEGKEDKSDVNRRRTAYKRQRSNLNMPKSVDASSTKEKKGKNKDFWEKHFQRQEAVDWTKFKEVFCKDYSDQLNAQYGQENIEWLMAVIHREIDEDEDAIIQKFHYDEFCFLDGEKTDFWRCVQQQALESYTMRLVFNMDSTVRIDAIQNLAKFNSPTVLEALLDLCKDKDPNVKAVAAISLARVGSSGNKRVTNSLLRLLRDKDRLVRESGCLSLGYIKAKQAVSTIVHLWRNDPISNVREAAQVALEKIGGEEAQKAMHITRVLQDEIKALALKS
ncbi:uncharacterized protein [Amphiura filiformis]|uniref:uncharacterized protein n=1 Tax=Amphiura filiformis TaxID=82378 RepID=UPI003B21CB88